MVAATPVASMTDTELPPAFPMYAVPRAPTATPNGCAPTATWRTTARLAVSISLAVPEPWLATQRSLPSGDIANRSGLAPTLIGVPAVCVATSMGCTVPSPKLLTPTVVPSGVTAGSAATEPTGIVAITVLSAVEITDTLLLLLLAT